MPKYDNVPWIGVDLDGVLAQYDAWRGIEHIGEPVPAMVARVRKWLSEGKQVKIFTARVARIQERAEVIAIIQKWLVEKCGLPALPVTNMKDMQMIELWDDRCVQVQKNTGARLIDEVLKHQAAQCICGSGAE